MRKVGGVAGLATQCVTVTLFSCDSFARPKNSKLDPNSKEEYQFLGRGKHALLDSKNFLERRLDEIGQAQWEDEERRRYDPVLAHRGHQTEVAMASNLFQHEYTAKPAGAPRAGAANKPTTSTGKINKFRKLSFPTIFNDTLFDEHTLPQPQEHSGGDGAGPAGRSSPAIQTAAGIKATSAFSPRWADMSDFSDDEEEIKLLRPSFSISQAGGRAANRLSSAKNVLGAPLVSDGTTTCCPTPVSLQIDRIIHPSDKLFDSYRRAIEAEYRDGPSRATAAGLDQLFGAAPGRDGPSDVLDDCSPSIQDARKNTMNYLSSTSSSSVFINLFGHPNMHLHNDQKFRQLRVFRGQKFPCLPVRLTKQVGGLLTTERTTFGMKAGSPAADRGNKTSKNLSSKVDPSSSCNKFFKSTSYRHHLEAHFVPGCSWNDYFHKDLRPAEQAQFVNFHDYNLKILFPSEQGGGFNSKVPYVKSNSK